jgi:hypothetical protein
LVFLYQAAAEAPEEKETVGLTGLGLEGGWRDAAGRTGGGSGGHADFYFQQ